MTENYRYALKVSMTNYKQVKDRTYNLITFYQLNDEQQFMNGTRLSFECFSTYQKTMLKIIVDILVEHGKVFLVDNDDGFYKTMTLLIDKHMDLFLSFIHYTENINGYIRKNNIINESFIIFEFKQIEVIQFFDFIEKTDYDGLKQRFDSLTVSYRL